MFQMEKTRIRISSSLVPDFSSPERRNSFRRFDVAAERCAVAQQALKMKNRMEMEDSIRYLIHPMQAFSKRPFAIYRPGHHEAARIGLGQWLIRAFLLALFSNLAGAISAGAASNDEQIATLNSQMNAAILRVQQIVNQPVTELRRTPDMQVAELAGGWFHPGAGKPSFLTVDVRKTQKFPYSRFQYVTSDLDPGVVFVASELEFNPMTKYFYTNRSVPKKRLTEAEMLEINQLYRVIGRCEHQLLDLENPISTQSAEESQNSDESESPQPMLATIHRWIFTHKSIAIGIVAGLFVLLIFLRKLRAQEPAD
jgi:hypothetical protein